MRLILPIGTTETALIDGLSAAGASPEVMKHTPPGDAEIVVYGKPTVSPVIPVSPSGCPTPATVTRAVREVVEFDVSVVDAGITESTDVPLVEIGATSGNDIRDSEAVPDAAAIFDRAHSYGSRLPDDELLIGETIPGGTTTALGIATALGEPIAVSSTLIDNPIERKRSVVDAGLESSGLEPGDCVGDPLDAIRYVGDPVQATVMGITAGALETGTDVTLAGGTQMVTAVALLRHAGIDDRVSVATTSFVDDDCGDALEEVCEELDCNLCVTDPGFDASDHVAMKRYCAGEAKEGVAMGGSLSLVPDGKMAAVRSQVADVCARLGLEEDGLTGDEDGASVDKDGLTEA